MKILSMPLAAILVFVLGSCEKKDDPSLSDNKYPAPAGFEEVDQTRFKEILDSSGEFVILKVYSDSCHYCKKYAPTLERLAEGNPDITFVKTIVPANSSWAQTEKHKGTPTVKIYKNGKLVSYLVGIYTVDELNTEIAKYQ